MRLFDFPGVAEASQRTPFAFGFSVFDERWVHFHDFVMFAIDRGLQVGQRITNALHRAEVRQRMHGFSVGGRSEQPGNLRLPFCIRFLRESGVLAVGL